MSVLPTPAPGPAPTPTPRPAPTGNSAGAQAFKASGITLPDVGSSKSEFGLGPLSTAPVQVGGLLPVMGKDGKAVTPGQGGTYTAEQVMRAFASASPSLVAQIQHMLMLGGFYGAPKANGELPYTPNYGVLNPQDLDAFAKATSTAAQTGGDLREYLGRQAKFGEYQGVAAAINANGAGKTRLITKADPLALASTIEKEYQTLTGRKPNEAERAGFIAAYNAAYTQFQNNKYDSEAAAAAGTGPSASTDYSTAAPPPISGFDGTHFSDHLSSDGPALTQAQDQANLGREPQIIPGSTPSAVTQQEFDPAAFAEQYVREHATGETDAHDVASQFKSFMNIIQGGVG